MLTVSLHGMLLRMLLYSVEDMLRGMVLLEGEEHSRCSMNSSALMHSFA